MYLLFLGISVVTKKAKYLPHPVNTQVRSPCSRVVSNSNGSGFYKVTLHLANPLSECQTATVFCQRNACGQFVIVGYKIFYCRLAPKPLHKMPLNTVASDAASGMWCPPDSPLVRGLMAESAHI
jgi:hypothetical protein